LVTQTFTDMGSKAYVATRKSLLYSVTLCLRSEVSSRKSFEISLVPIAVEELRRRRRKNATRRRVILTSVVSASSHRRRGWLFILLKI